MHRTFLKLILCALPFTYGTIVQAQSSINHSLDFESVDVGSPGYINGSTLGGAGAISIDGFQFSNEFQDLGGYTAWSGFAISNHSDRSNPTYTNQFSSYIVGPDGSTNASGGANGSSNFAVGYMDGWDMETDTSKVANLRALPTIDLLPGAQIHSLQIANTTYTASTILVGDAFTAPFKTGDLYEVSIFGVDANDTILSPVTFRLADYVSSSGSGDGFVLSQWETIDLQNLVDAKSLHFLVTTTSIDPQWGPSTPLYFAIDNLNYSVAAVPEPSSIALCSFLLIGGYAARRKRKLVGVAK